MIAPRPGEALPLSRSLALDPDPLALFRRLCGDTTARAVLLESADGSTLAGERSILMSRAALKVTARDRRVRFTPLGAQGRDVLPWIQQEIPESQIIGDELIVDYSPPVQGCDEEQRMHAPSPIDALRTLAKWRLVSRPARRCLLLPGVFAYDFLECYEDLPRNQDDPLAWPDFEFYLPAELVVIDHRARRCRVFALVYGGENAEAAYHDAARRIDVLAAACAATPENRPPEAPASRPEIAEDRVVADMSAEDYARQVLELKALIAAGEVYQIVPSRTFRAPCPDPVAAYERLRALNPSPYMFLFKGPERWLFGASPETAVKVSGEPRTIELCPIAGTRPRGKDQDGGIDPELDSRIELSLRTDQKELAEHLMLVDIARNDAARVSVPGTREVARLLAVDRYSHVMHLVSNVRGELRPEVDALQAYVASMNMGTLVGAPKLRAAQILRGVERTRRGPYGGAVGYITPDGELDTCIVIRSAAVIDGQAYVRAGAGVVHDSDPDAEADETRRKANAVLQALEASP